MPVYKATNEVQEIGIIGYRCFNPEPVPSAPLNPGGGPQPPQIGVAPPSPPDESSYDVRIGTIRDMNGDCWRIVIWTSGSGLQKRMEKIAIDCADL